MNEPFADERDSPGQAQFMKKTLLIAYIHTHFVELIRVARLLKQSGSSEPVILFAGEYENFDRDRILCEQEAILWRALFKIRYLPQGDAATHHHAPATTRQQGKTLWKNLERQKETGPVGMRWLVKIGMRAFSFFMTVLRGIWLLIYIQRYQKAYQVIKNEKVDLLILCEENVGYATELLVKAGKRLQVPTIVVPFTVANASEAAETFKNSRAYSWDLVRNRWIGGLFPKWVFWYQGKRMVRLPAEQILAQEILRIVPDNPWMINSGGAGAIAVESDMMQEYYLREKIPAQKLFLTGSLSDDVLYENLSLRQEKRKLLERDFDLKKSRPIILCGLPPDQFPRDIAFPNYSELVRFWLESITAIEGWNIIIKLHPRTAREEIDFLDQYDAFIMERDTAELVPLCDLFVASVSATIRWAIACGIPVVNYDVYQMGYRDYAQAGGVLTMNQSETFLATLRHITSDREYYEHVSALAKKASAHWGMVDGKSGARMLKLFDAVTAKTEQNLAN